ncbi:hypothetical protein EV363DRAFT_1584269 [Boletus edulis]|nr:hypothetical protein EV363DRAFT_1584269 [Boletus edulis]
MSTNPLAPPLGSIYGSIFFGTITSTAFYGIACMQTFFYYVHYQNDPLRIKILVATQWALNTISECFRWFVSQYIQHLHVGIILCIIAYKYIMVSLGSPLPIASGISELILQNFVAALVAALTQGFLLYRIYVFCGKKTILPLIWIVAALGEFVCCTVYVKKALCNANGIHVDVRVLNSGSFVIIATLGLSVAAGIDVLIAVFMTFLFVRQRIATNFANTAHLLQRLIMFAVNTGTWTALFSLLTIILLHLSPSNLIYTAFVIPQYPVYCNTHLANLNARAYVGRGGTTHDDDSGLFTTPLASLQMSNRTENDEHGGEGR